MSRFTSTVTDGPADHGPYTEYLPLAASLGAATAVFVAPLPFALLAAGMAWKAASNTSSPA